MGGEGDENTGKLKLVSERTEAELVAESKRREAEDAAEQLAYATRNLAANILRIIAGGGKHYNLAHQVMAVAKGIEELRHFCGSASYSSNAGSAMAAALGDLDWRKNSPAFPNYKSVEELEPFDSPVADLERSKGRVLTAALRLTAARLLRQSAQESTTSGQLDQEMLRFAARRYERPKAKKPGGAGKQWRL